MQSTVSSNCFIHFKSNCANVKYDLGQRLLTVKPVATSELQLNVDWSSNVNGNARQISQNECCISKWILPARKHHLCFSAKLLHPAITKQMKCQPAGNILILL